MPPPHFPLPSAVSLLVLVGSVSCGGTLFTVGNEDGGTTGSAGITTGASATTGGSTGETGADSSATMGTTGAGSTGNTGLLGTTGLGTTGIGVTGRDAAAPVSMQLSAVIDNDADDAEWIGGTDERLHYSSDQTTIEVGVDQDMGRVGLRFQLAIPAGATINSARLYLHRLFGQAGAKDTMQVQVYDTNRVPRFDDSHVHLPEAHAPEGLWSGLVGGYLLGMNGATLQSPELKSLVQHVVGKAEWRSGDTVGFVLSPENMSAWAEFDDVSHGDPGAELRVVYTR